MFVIFIPVYAFLMLPAVATLMGDTNEFLARSAKVQWGLMLTVFSISHAPALLMLDTGVEGALLIVYLIVVVQLSDVFQYVWGKLIGKHRFSPNISPSKTVEGLVGGGLSAIAVGTLLHPMTPFSPLQAAGGQHRHRDRRVLRRLRALRHQARPQGEGLGLHHRRPRRGARPRRTRSPSPHRCSSTSRATGSPRERHAPADGILRLHYRVELAKRRLDISHSSRIE